ncbi:MAG: TolC family protein [Candidatus Eremiobacteraeota bacterium]|nr:TolC family protein [Candidatus Eremiobacteraeota bacterium]
MRKTLNAALLVLFVALLTTLSHGQSVEERAGGELSLAPRHFEEYLKSSLPLPLTDALKKVIEGNYAIKAQQEEEGAARAGFDYAKSFGLPRVDLQLGYTVSDNPVNVFAFKLNQARFTMQDFDIQSLNDPASTTNFNAGLQVKYPLYTGGRVELAMDAAKENIKASRQATSETSRGMLSNMLQSYLAGALLIETIKVLDESLQVAEKQVKLARSFYDHGLVVKSDVLGAEVYFAMTLQERNRVFGKLQNLNEVLNRLMGIEEKRSYSLDYDFGMLPEVREDYAALEKMALEKRPDYIQVLHQRTAFAKMKSAEERSSQPEVGFYGLAQHNDRGFFVQGSGDMTAGIYASMPLFDGGQRKARVDEYRAKLKALDHRIEMLRLTIRGEVRESLTDYNTALANIRASEQQVSQAKENFRIVSNRYRAGLSTSLDVQQSETVERQAKLSRLSASHDIQAAFYRIQVATGAIIDGMGLSAK